MRKPIDYWGRVFFLPTDEGFLPSTWEAHWIGLPSVYPFHSLDEIN